MQSLQPSLPAQPLLNRGSSYKPLPGIPTKLPLNTDFLSPSRFAPSRFLQKARSGNGDVVAGGGGMTFRGSTLMHKGFFDLVALLKGGDDEDDTSTINIGGAQASPLSVGRRYEDIRKKVTMGRKSGQQFEGVPKPTSFPKSKLPQSAFENNVLLKKGRRISKEMISGPKRFQHVLHASSVDEAQEILMRWSAEGVGKIADPKWADPIKTLVKARAIHQQTVAISRAQLERDLLERYVPPLRIMNGAPSSLTSSTTGGHSDEAPIGYHPSSLSPVTTAGPSYNDYRHQNPPPSPQMASGPQIEVGQIYPRSDPASVQSPNSPNRRSLLSASPPSPRFPPTPAIARAQTAQTFVVTPPLSPEHPSGLQLEPTTTFSSDATPKPALISPTTRRPLPTPPDLPPRKPKPIVPSLETLEKASAVAIYFETLYHSILKSPNSHQALSKRREARRLALEKEMETWGVSEAEKREARERWREAETEWLREKRKKVSPNSFKVVKIIGQGAFGVVSLVREKETNGLYAMKKLRKADMLRKGQEGHVRSERDLLAAASSGGGAGARWIVKLNYSFQDVDHLYLVLDFMGGGDLLNLLVEKDIFPEDFTKFYIAEMILALEETHKLGFLHRDIKPDNFLFTNEGHIKISDFGLATDLHWAHDSRYYEAQRKNLLKKHGIDLENPRLSDQSLVRKIDPKMANSVLEGTDGKNGLLTWREKNRKKLAYSVCGTNSYMSCEVVRGLGYGTSCDWWSLGVIMFECLYGYPPFVSQSRHVTRQKILNWKNTLKFPPRPKVSREAIDLMQSLLCEPEDRLGSPKGGIDTGGSQPNSVILQQRQSGFINPQQSNSFANDGASQLKAHPWFKGIDFTNIHNESPPYKPDLRDPTDTKHFDDDIPDQTLAPPGGAAPDATKDPLLKHELHGAKILHLRKEHAFAGFTYKSPKLSNSHRQNLLSSHSPADENNDSAHQSKECFRQTVEPSATRSRAISL